VSAGKGEVNTFAVVTVEAMTAAQSSPPPRPPPEPEPKRMLLFSSQITVCTTCLVVINVCTLHARTTHTHAHTQLLKFLYYISVHNAAASPAPSANKAEKSSSSSSSDKKSSLSDVKAKLKAANEEKPPEMVSLQQEENVSISGSNARLMVMQRLTRKNEVSRLNVLCVVIGSNS